MKITNETSRKIEINVDELIKLFIEKGWLPDEYIDFRSLQLIEPVAEAMMSSPMKGKCSAIKIEYNFSEGIVEEND